MIDSLDRNGCARWVAGVVPRHERALVVVNQASDHHQSALTGVDNSRGRVAQRLFTLATVA